MAIRYDDNHYIVFDVNHEKVQEGYRCTAWVELANGGIASEDIYHGVAARKERATELAREKAIAAIQNGTVRFPAPKK
ncbi:hypothetical protein ABH944_008409 [Caballeronia udeis]|uniref:DUF2188 domain-containing protein n=1 Tax=Caballeronia udeis TaxID=1232866 RepID=A0ABW8N014_9BURK